METARHASGRGCKWLQPVNLLLLLLLNSVAVVSLSWFSFLHLVAVFGTAMLMHQSEWGTWLYPCVCITLQLPCGVYELELETHALMWTHWPSPFYPHPHLWASETWILVLGRWIFFLYTLTLLLWPINLYYQLLIEKAKIYVCVCARACMCCVYTYVCVLCVCVCVCVCVWWVVWTWMGESLMGKWVLV